MRYLGKTLQEGEKPVCRTHLHWIYLMNGFWWFVLLAGFGWISDYLIWVNFGQYIPVYNVTLPYFSIGLEPGLFGWITTVGGVYIFLRQLIKYWSTDILVTTKRLLYKHGFINVKIDATGIDDILGAHVDQGWFGQFFGYGKLHLDCRFIDDAYIPYAKNPYGIMRAIDKIRSQMQHGGSEHPVLEEERPQLQKIERPVSQTLIQITGNNPVYIVDKIPADEKTPLKQLPKALGKSMMSTFKRKA